MLKQPRKRRERERAIDGTSGTREQLQEASTNRPIPPLGLGRIGTAQRILINQQSISRRESVSAFVLLGRRREQYLQTDSDCLEIVYLFRELEEQQSYLEHQESIKCNARSIYLPLQGDNQGPKNTKK
mmetsp:Transcript_1322/g.1616  ORF Transcript_1322/g.1616 Transcript_1322/m.1616 type:complete len:128 (-) Transcript_1322:261-644(-)